nr:ABC transporter ATP-binding protein [Paenibacillus sacheonensis]
MFSYVQPYRFWVGIKLLSTTLNAGNDIFLVYILNILVNASLAGDRPDVIKSIVYMFASVMIGLAVHYFDTYAAGRYSAYAARDMKNSLANQIDRLPVSYLDTHHSGELNTRMTASITTIENFLSGDLAALLFHLIRIGVSLTLMLFMNVPLTLFCIVMLPLAALFTNAIGKPLNSYSSRLQQSIARTNHVAQDTINGIHVVKSNNLLPVLLRKFTASLDQMLADALRIEKRNALMGSVSVFVQLAPFLAFFLFGAYLVTQGLFTGGGLVAFALLLSYLVQGLSALPNGISNYKVTIGVAEHLFAVLDLDAERTGTMHPELSSGVPALAFEQVSFSYDGQKQLLNGVSFVLEQGKKTAVVGASGSGKSTLFKLIAGYYAQQSGSLKMFDEPLSSWELSHARSKVALVSQDTFLFSGTIADNISCGDTGFTRLDVERAAQSANIHVYIQSLPAGYDTLVGERGVKLSGGQRQRISIARAILKDAPILLLDEATSALDTESEMLVQDAINRSMKGKSVLVIAHRLSTIIDADEVLVLDNGAIAERGTHAELLMRDGVYKRLYNHQLIQQQADGADSLMESKEA